MSWMAGGHGGDREEGREARRGPVRQAVISHGRLFTGIMGSHGRVFSRKWLFSSPVPLHHSSVPRQKQHGEWTESVPKRPEAGLQPAAADTRTG